MPAIDRGMFSGSVDAGFILVLPFHHGDLEPDCVGVSMRGGGGLCTGSLKMQGGGEGVMREGGCIRKDTTVYTVHIEIFLRDSIL